MPTQTERREATRTAVLEATMELLVTQGYAATTTGRVAAVAGVSRGAAPHYFASKADMVAEALSHLARRRIEGIRDAVPAGDARWSEAVLDLIWEAHHSDLFTATIELWAAARGDEQLRGPLMAAEQDVRRAIGEAFADVAGPRVNEPGFREDMELVLATVRGLALLPLLEDTSHQAVERRWRAARERLLRILD